MLSFSTPNMAPKGCLSRGLLVTHQAHQPVIRTMHCQSKKVEPHLLDLQWAKRCQLIVSTLPIRRSATRFCQLTSRIWIRCWTSNARARLAVSHLRHSCTMLRKGAFPHVVRWSSFLIDFTFMCHSICMRVCQILANAADQVEGHAISNLDCECLSRRMRR